MGEEHRHALARLCAEDEEFNAAILGAASVEDAVRVARERGINATVEDFAPSDGALSEDELSGSVGGTGRLEPSLLWCPSDG